MAYVRRTQGILIGEVTAERIKHYVLHGIPALGITKLVRDFGTVHEHGCGIEVVRAAIPDDPVVGIFTITIWKRFKMYAIVGLPEHLGNEPPIEVGVQGRSILWGV